MECLRGLKTSDTCLEPSAQSHAPTPQDVLLATSTSETYVSAGDGTEIAAMRPLPKGLPDLYTDVILMVAGYLPPSSRMSLNYSCRSIRDKLGDPIEKLLGVREKAAQLPRTTLNSRLPTKLNVGLLGQEDKWSSPIRAKNAHHTERLHLLSMLDRDGMIPPSKAVCSGCANTHDRSLFSSESLAQSSSERRCLGSAGRVWICPHWIFDHNLVTTSSKPQGPHPCGEGCVHVMLKGHTFTEPTIVWPVAVFGDNDAVPSKNFVENILAGTDQRVCKHLHFSDHFVSSIYSPECKNLWTDSYHTVCACSTCARQPQTTTDAQRRDYVSGGKCESCGTSVYFNIGAIVLGERKLQICVRRKIPTFRGCTDPAWIEQVDDPRECEELERKWYKAMDEDIPVWPNV